MKCVYNRDILACMVTMPPGEAGNVSWKPNPDDPKKPIPYWPKGTVREGPFAVMHCRQGFCDPADDECAQALGFTEEQMAAARHRYQRIVDGIQPEDFDQYDAGVMVGYDAMGNWIPGPNFEKFKAAEAANESDI